MANRPDLSRPGLQGVSERLQGPGLRMHGERLDRPVRSVPNLSRDAEQRGAPTHEGAESNALNPPFDFDSNRWHLSSGAPPPKGYTFHVISVLLATPDPSLGDLARRSVETALAAVAPKASPDDVGVAVGVVDRASRTIRWGGFNETKTHYPASTVKLFWLAYVRHRIAEGKLRETPELQRAMRDMIVDSTNDATALVVDAATETTGGAELSPKALKRWMDRRQAANRWFASLGYSGVNASQKTWNEGPYGRERQGYGPNFEHRNAMSPLAGMRLLGEIMLDRIVDPAACESMRKLLHRTNLDDAQRKGFSGGQLTSECEVWSKAGWTSTVKCDLAWIKAPDGREVTLALFTDKSAMSETLLPRIARELLRGLKMPLGEGGG